MKLRRQLSRNERIGLVLYGIRYVKKNSSPACIAGLLFFYFEAEAFLTEMRIWQTVKITANTPSGMLAITAAENRKISEGMTDNSTALQMPCRFQNTIQIRQYAAAKVKLTARYTVSAFANQ